MGNLTRVTRWKLKIVSIIYSFLISPILLLYDKIPSFIGHKVPKPKSDQMKRITKRDIVAFIIGLLFMGIMDVAFNWEETKTVFSKGFNDGYIEGNTRFKKGD